MKTNEKIKIELTESEADWLSYCLRYVQECYQEDELLYEMVSPDRMRELKIGLKLYDRLNKAMHEGTKK